MKRSIGPVTTSATLGSVAGVLLLGIVTRLGLAPTELETAAIIALPTLLGGFLVKPPGKRERRDADNGTA